MLLKQQTRAENFMASLPPPSECCLYVGSMRAPEARSPEIYNSRDLPSVTWAGAVAR